MIENKSKDYYINQTIRLISGRPGTRRKSFKKLSRSHQARNILFENDLSV
jgi:hypothetical protein